MRERLVSPLLAAALATACCSPCRPPCTPPGAAPRAARPPSQGAASTARAKAPKGRSAIVGTARRGGEATSAHVELRFLATTASRDRRRHGGVDAIEGTLTEPYATSGPAAAVAIAGADGRFSFEGIGPGEWSVVLVAPDGRRAAEVVLVPVDGARVEAMPTIEDGDGTLRGRVQHADGSPFRGLVFVLEPAVSVLGSSFPVALDATGSFSLSGLPPGSVRVVALSPGSRRVTDTPGELPCDGVFRLDIDGESSLAGRVIAAEDGRPVPGADIVGRAIDGAAGEVVVARAVAGTDGSFSLDLLGSEAATLWIRAPGFAPAVERIEASPAPVEVRLRRGARLEGKVVSATDGAPRAGVTVRVVGRGFARHLEPTTSDEEGRYAFDGLEAGVATVVASGAGWVTGGAEHASDGGFNPFLVELAPARTTSFDLEVVPGWAVRGRVVDEESRFVGGAVVTLWPAQTDRNSPLAALSQNSVLATDEAGGFSFDSLLPRMHYEMRVVAPGRSPFWSRLRRIEDDEPGELHITLPAARFLYVSVLDESGRGVPGAAVRASEEDASPTSWTLPAAGRTGPDGHARLGPVGLGDVEVRVHAPDFVRARATTVSAGEDRVEVRLERGLRIVGRVLRPDGSPAAGAFVRATKGARAEDTRAGAGGAFRIRGLSPGPWRLGAATTPRRADGPAVVVEAGRADVVLFLAEPPEPHGRSLRLKVLDPDGLPVPRARAQFAWKPPGSSTLRREASVVDGTARFELLDGREGVLHVTHALRLGDLSPAGGAIRISGVVPGDDEVVVRLPRDRAARGRVVGPDDAGVRGVHVRATWPPEYEDGAPPQLRNGVEVAQAWTGPDGAFVLRGLGGGSCTLRLSVGLDFVPPADLVVDGGPDEVVVSLRRSVAATIVVLDESEDPVPGVRVSASTSDGRAAAGETGRTGTVRLVGLDPTAAHRLALYVPGPAERYRRHADIRDWKPRGEVLRLETAYPVRGVVRDGAGFPLGGARVEWVVADGSSGAVDSDANGTFVVRGLGRGSVRLRAGLDVVRGDPPWTTVEAGASDVALRVDAGEILRVGAGRSSNWPESTRVTLFEVQPDGTRRDVATKASRGGGLTFGGLDAGVTYALFLGPTSDGRSASLEGVKAPGTVQADLVPGEAVHVLVDAPPGARRPVVRATLAEWPVPLPVREGDADYEVLGAPAGTRCVVRASATVDGKAWRGEAVAIAGATVTVRLAPEEARNPPPP